MVAGLLIRRRPELLLLARSGVRMMNLFHRVHAAVCFGEEAFHIEAIFGTEGHADTQSDQIASANVTPGSDSCLVEPLGFFLRRLRSQAGSGNHELVPAHAGNVVVT